MGVRRLEHELVKQSLSTTTFADGQRCCHWVRRDQENRLFILPIYGQYY